MLETKYNGKEPEVLLAAGKGEDETCSVAIKGDDISVLIMLTAIVNALKERMPSSLIKGAVGFAFDEDIEKLFKKTAIIDMTELQKQFGK